MINAPGSAGSIIVIKQGGKMATKKEIKKIVLLMAKLLPISLEDAAAIIYSINTGYDTTEILKKVKVLKIEERNLKIKIGKRIYCMTPNGSGGVAYIPYIKKTKKEKQNEQNQN